MLEQLIKEKAYQIWEQEGFPEGRAEAHWELAKRAVSQHDLLTRETPAAIGNSTKRASKARSKKPKTRE